MRQRLQSRLDELEASLGDADGLTLEAALSRIEDAERNSGRFPTYEAYRDACAGSLNPDLARALETIAGDSTDAEWQRWEAQDREQWRQARAQYLHRSREKSSAREAEK